jgi:hypothetical protein
LIKPTSHWFLSLSSAAMLCKRATTQDKRFVHRKQVTPQDPPKLLGVVELCAVDDGLCGGTGHL